jgi:hypothetical protein
MISHGRYVRHLEDIAAYELLPKPMDALIETRLERIRREVAAFEAVTARDDVERLQRLAERNIRRERELENKL